MTEVTTRQAAAAARAAGVRQPTNRPCERSANPDGGLRGYTPGLTARLEVRAATEDAPLTFEGYASVTEEPYEMYDMFGPYTEVVDRAAFDNTLRADPDVKLLFNHKGMPMARTHQASNLTLSADERGLHVLAQPIDIPLTREIAAGIEAKVLDEMSFAFFIVRGSWSPDYTEYRIHEVDINRGDVAIVTYGANPATTVGLRSQQEQEPAQSRRSTQARIDAALALLRPSRA